MEPPRRWESFLKRVLPPGTVGRSILGDLREEHARRAERDSGSARRWYREAVLGIVARALRDRMLGRWSGDPRLGPRTDGGQGKGDPMIERFTRALKYAVRSLARTPRFTAIAVFTIMLGIAVDTTVFSVVNGVLLKSLPYPHSDELVDIWSSAVGLGYNRFPLSPDIYYFYRSQNHVFADMAIYSQEDVSVTGSGRPERVSAVSATASLFSTLGVSPMLGRAYTAVEDVPDGPAVVVISHALWQRRFGADPAVIGRTLEVDGVSRRILGVMPPRFDFPAHVDLWYPAGFDAANPPAGNFVVRGIGRLAPGHSPEQAQAELVALTKRFAATLGELPRYRALFSGKGRYAPLVHSMKQDLVGDLERPLWILLGTVGFVLLIACANVANLVLIRSEVRRRESAVRTALGASRGSLLRQSTAEATLLAVAGGALGVLVAWLGMPVLLRHAPPQLPRLGDVGMDGTVLLFAVGITAAAALLSGVAPVIRRSPSALLGALSQGGRGGTSSRRTRRARDLLVVGQTAMALVLLVGSGLLVRSFWRVRDTDLGFDYRDLLTFRLTVPEAKYPRPTQVTAFHEELLSRLRALPGVESVAVGSAVPLAQGSSESGFEIADHPTQPDQLPPIFGFEYVSPGFMRALRIHLLAGRAFRLSDEHDGAGHVLVDQTLANSIWPGESALGKRLRFSGDSTRWYAVEGVVAPVIDRLNHGGPVASQGPTPMVYFPMASPDGDKGWALRGATYVVRVRNPAALAASVRSTVWSVDPDMPVASMSTGDQLVASSMVQLSFTMFTLGIAAVLALVLGAVGLYGVLSYSVAQRTQEIGVRMALGAERGTVMRMVVGDGAKITLVGLVLGLAGAVALTRLLAGILYHVKTLDPLTFGATTFVLLAVGLLAAYLPARRAAAVDPMDSIRAE